MTTVKEELLKRIRQLFSVFTPLIMYLFIDHQWVMLMPPIIIEIIDWIAEKWYSKVDYDYVRQNMESIIIERNYYQYSPYTQCCWYISKNCKLSSMSLVENIESRNHREEIDIPIYHISPKMNTEIVHNGNKIYIATHAEEDDKKRDRITTIILYATDINILKDFINYVYVEFTTHCKKKQIHEYYNLYNYSISMLEWKKSQINVKKNKENVFLNEDNGKIFGQIEKFLQSEQIYTSKGIPYKKGILLYGLPGTGKSSVVYAIANEFKRNIYKLSLLKMDDNDVLAAISMIPENSVLLIEDIDTIKELHQRKDEGDKEKKTEYKIINLATILNIFDGYSFLKGCIIICTTNHKEKLDSALIRHGRIDQQYEFGYASIEQKKQITSFYDMPQLLNDFVDKDITTSEIISECLAKCDNIF